MMTPHDAPPPGSRGGGFASGLTIGLVVAGAVACLSLSGGYALVKYQVSNAKKGWNLVPVVVAAVDISEGTVVTMEMISQRSIPEQFVTSSVVKPDSASYIVNQKITVPVQQGDPLLWSQFETKKGTKLLFAANDVAAGKPLAEADCEEREVVLDIVTPSWVKTEDRPQAVGRAIIAPFRKGDPILWTHLKAPAAE